MRVSSVWIAFLPLYGVSSPSNPNMPLDRPFTLINESPFLLEQEYGRMADSEASLEFIFPRPCTSLLDGSRVCQAPYRIAHASEDAKESLGLRLLAGGEYRHLEGDVWATEAGILVGGHKGPVSFGLDARLFTEATGDASRGSYDREDVDVQDDDLTGSVSYSSFSRYRGNLNLDTPFGRFTAARDAVHWGPGIFNNLVFHQDAVPFHQVLFRTQLGPVSVQTLYGDLAIGESQGGSAVNRQDRNLYAHRYELRAGGNTVLGFSEQLVLHDLNKPALLVPIFPLFIAKTVIHEESNNGNLALDAAYRFPDVGMIYAEVFLDDLESPSSLFLKDYVQNKWAWMAGFHLVKDVRGFRCGLISEYSRIEPWVYAHFTPQTAQTANLGYPLGNQQGPNSQSLAGKVYARSQAGLYFGLKLAAYWKGRDLGSSLEDATPRDPTQGKTFLGGESSPDIHLEPSLACTLSWLHISGGARLGDSPGAWARALVGY